MMPRRTTQQLQYVFAVSVFLATCLVCGADYSAPRYDLDLDLSPAARWNDIVTDVMSEHGGFDPTFGPAIDMVHSMVPQKDLKLLDPLFEKVVGQLGDYGEEIKGMYASFVAAGYGDKASLGELVLLNFVYELQEFCTSITSQHSNGTMYHGRNLDFTDFGLRNLTAQINFKTGGETSYTGTVFVGYVGLLTGMRPGGFSVSINQRETITPENIVQTLFQIAESILFASKGGNSIGFFIRSTLAEQPTFDSAVEALNSGVLISECYLIVSGVTAEQGVIITRNRDAPDESHGEGVWRLQAEKGVWYRLQTNYDHWLEPPVDDDRRHPAMASMEKMGQMNLSPDGLFSLLSIPPVLSVNESGSPTIYTTIMVPATGHYTTMVRDIRGN